MLVRLIRLYTEIIGNNAKLSDLVNSIPIMSTAENTIFSLFKHPDFSWSMINFTKQEYKLYQAYIKQCSIAEAITIYNYNMCLPEDNAKLYRKIVRNKEKTISALIHGFNFNSSKDKKDYITLALADHQPQLLEYFYYQLDQSHINKILHEYEQMPFDPLLSIFANQSIPNDFKTQLLDKISYTFDIKQYSHLFNRTIYNHYNIIGHICFNYVIQHMPFTFFEKYLDVLDNEELSQIYSTFYKDILNCKDKFNFCRYSRLFGRFLTTEHKDRLIDVFRKVYKQYRLDIIMDKITFSQEQMTRINAIKCLEQLE